MRNRILDLNMLLTLVTIADTGTVTAAAERLAYTQSTVSMQLHRLENAVGVPLHERDGRRIRFTPEGQKLVGYARKMLELNNEALDDVQQQQIAGELNLGIPEDYAFLLTSVLSHFNRQFPAVQLQVTCRSSVELVKQVQAGSMDLAVVTRQARSPGGEVIRREPLMWAVGATAQPSLLDPIPLALYSPGADVFRDAAEQALASAGRDWRMAYSSQSMTGLMPVVAAGLAVVVVTRNMLTPQLRVLDERNGMPPLQSVDIALHRPPGRPSEPAKQLAELIRNHLSTDEHNRS
ncbi:LysR family transcriptional regulator [Streptosporangium jomthongense]|uniref:LysR substrate-binding domain-containing protein n=1 Tax=Marinobacter aromaticivorans TaxID=1494078 RepID=A0ABW2ITJ3_9GAMM|nr:LysR substrate-binding domain-containing protein [Marinobacter aromaticivorans]GGE59195.1 LysR family transcriptional regulator [Streptosporangium jomthongense]